MVCGDVGAGCLEGHFIKEASVGGRLVSMWRKMACLPCLKLSEPAWWQARLFWHRRRLQTGLWQSRGQLLGSRDQHCWEAKHGRDSFDHR